MNAFERCEPLAWTSRCPCNFGGMPLIGRLCSHGATISHYEWVQQIHLGVLLDELELGASSQVAYAAGVKTLLDLMRRGHPLEDLGPC